MLIKQNVRIIPKKRTAQDEIMLVPAVPVFVANNAPVADNNDQDDDYDMEN